MPLYPVSVQQKVPIRISFGGYEWRIIRKITVLGMTPFLIIAFDNVLIITFERRLQHYGGAEGDKLLTCATIVQSFMLMVTMPLGGITGGTEPILGYNFEPGVPTGNQSPEIYCLFCLGIYFGHVYSFTDPAPIILSGFSPIMKNIFH